MNIKFLGSTQTVTGSKHLLQGKDKNILIDCGLYQGIDSQKYNKEIKELLAGEKIDAIVLTHAHLDHCGYLPKLYKDGFRGPVFSTEATKDIANIVMSDNAHIQASDAKKINKKVTKEKLKLEPLYTQTEVNQVLSSFKTHEFNTPFKWEEFEIEFKIAGHILGASSPVIKNQEGSIQFSGDLGRKDDLIIIAPQEAQKVDTLVIESTYGNRDHEKENLNELLKKLCSKAKSKNNAIIIPAFSVGRSQMIMQLLYSFFIKNPELHIPVFVDSPMTQKVTALYSKYPKLHKISKSHLKKFQSKFHFVEFNSQKEKLDKMESAHIILTASGMLSGGNILHHLALKGDNPDNDLLIVGFQSEDSLGYELLQGNLTHTLDGQSVNIKAKIHKIKSLSSHADHNELIHWAKSSHAKKVFITHGEEQAKIQLQKDLTTELKTSVEIAKLSQNFSV